MAFDQLVMEISRARHCSYGDAMNSTGSEYDVFLSFRGPDTRNGITDHLYECMCGAGLRAFRDDEEIRRGEVIGGELEQAIINSRVYAVILSRNYVSSSWCLRELAMMVDLRRGLGVGRKIILPIFYGVDPCDVKLRTELYRNDLNKHEDRYGHDVVKKWEEALVTIGQINGWDSKAIHG